MIHELMEIHGTPTLASIARIFGISRERVYKVAKTPVTGKVFEPQEYNWEAVERFILRRLDPDIGLVTLEDVIIKASKDKDRRKSGTGYYSHKEYITVDGKSVPTRRDPNFEMLKLDGHDYHKKIHPTIAHVIMFRNDINVYKIVYQTKTHTVLRAINKVGEFSSDELKMVSNRYMNMNALDHNSATKEELEKRYNHQIGGDVVDMS